jgi:hypothetical protein
MKKLASDSLKRVVAWARIQLGLARGNTEDQIQLTLMYRQLLATEATAPSFRDVGFSNHSQYDEDGILLFIFATIGCTNRKCVEICCGNGIESNTANLLIHHGWTGVLFEGDPKLASKAQTFFRNCRGTRFWPPEVSCAWVTRENIDELLQSKGVEGSIDLLSLDMDGIDYWAWEALETARPRVIVLEYNHLWGPDTAVSVPYSPDFEADFTEYGSDYAGASIAAFVILGKKKGYRLVGCNSVGTNAFFVRQDIRCSWLPEVKTASCFEHPRTEFGRTQRLPKVKNKAWVTIT